MRGINTAMVVWSGMMENRMIPQRLGYDNRNSKNRKRAGPCDMWKAWKIKMVPTRW